MEERDVIDRPSKTSAVGGAGAKNKRLAALHAAAAVAEGGFHDLNS